MRKLSMRSTSYLGAIVCAGLAAAALGWQDPAEVDDEEAEIRALQGQLALTNSCTMCHSDTLIRSQRLTPAQWKASLDKMIGFGADVRVEDKEVLLGRLQAIHAEPAARIAIAQVSKPPWDKAVIEPSAAENRARGESLFQRHCASCHGATARGGDHGQNLVDTPILLNETAFAAVARDGRNRMPSFGGALQPNEIIDILSWLRTLTYEPGVVP